MKAMTPALLGTIPRSFPPSLQTRCLPKATVRPELPLPQSKQASQMAITNTPPVAAKSVEIPRSRFNLSDIGGDPSSICIEADSALRRSTMSNKIMDNGETASSEDSPELEAAEQSTSNHADLSASMRAGEMGFPPKDPMPMGNPKITVQS